MNTFVLKFKKFFKTTIEFILNPKLLLCFGIAWILTNGWAYIALGIGTWLNINWLTAVAGAYLAFLWIPVTPEKLITIVIAMFLLKLLFPEDKKTLKRLHLMKELIKRKMRKAKEKLKNKYDKK